jgi:hypothetical protein
MEKRGSRVAFAGISLVLGLVAFALAARGSVEHQSFKAFYCAGTAVRERADPYRVEPLRSCERRLETTPMPSGYVEPAPMPGYVLAFFALLSALSPKAAAALFALILAAAAVFSARALAAIIPAPSYAVLLALAPLTLLNVAYGEIPPLATLAICASGYYLANRRWHAAGIAAGLALVQPNVGLPAALAVFIFARQSRVALLATGAALAATSAAVLGISANVEYLTRVLPMMADAEIVASDQYSLSRLLYVLGAPVGVAMLVGKLWFAFAAMAGILIAGRWSAGSRRELLALLPPAAVTLFGIYLHDIQVIIALPAALFLAARCGGNVRTIAAVSMTLLVVVWTQPARPAVLLIDAAGAFGGVLAVTAGSSGRRFLAASAAALAAIVLVALISHASTATPLVTHAFYAAPNELSPIAWSRYLRATPGLMRPVLLPQILTWVGLIGIFACALGVTRAKMPMLSRS